MSAKRRRWFRPCLEALEDRCVPTTFTVSNLKDDGSAGSLRGAIDKANDLVHHPGLDSIVFKPGLEGTIPLNGTEIDIRDNLSLLGPGAAKVAVDARDLSRIFGLGPGNPNVLIQGLELRNCYATNGAAISASGNLTLVKTVISGNTTTGDGGAVAAYAALTIRQSIISGNTAASTGGGVYFAGTTLTVKP